MRKTTILLALGLLIPAAAVGLWGCAPDDPAGVDLPLDPATQIRTQRTVVSVGNSLTAGFLNGGLVITGQLASFPNTLARLTGSTVPVSPSVPMYVHMPLVGTGDDPTMVQQTGIGSTPGKSALYVDGVTGAVTTDDLLDPTALLLNATYPLAYDNLGVPGATTQDLFTAIDAASSQSGTNAFFDLILRNSALPPFNATELDQLQSHFAKETIVGVDGTGAPIYDVAIPAVITVWIGNNDILGGALSGNPVVGTNVVPASVWEGMYVSILDQVAEMAAVGESKVVLGNIQDRLPYFDTVPLGADVGGNFVPWNTEESNVQYVLLTAQTLDPPLGPDYLAPAGGTEVIPGSMTFTQTEWDDLLTQIQAYNQIILDQATARGWGHADIRETLSTLPVDPGDPDFGTLNGLFPWLDLTGDGSPEQNTTSAFSLDGIHPSEKGYTAVANAFAAALNAAYGTPYPSVDVTSVINFAGFEQVLMPPAKPVAGAVQGLAFTREGAAGLRSVGTLMGSGR